MYVAYTPEEEALRTELRAYFATLMTPEVEAEVANGDTGGPHCLAAVKKMGRDGWLGIGWPKEYGGQGRGLVDQFIFYDESWRALAPIPALTINAIAHTIMAYGSDEQKRFFLPRILKGALHFAVGYTEPQAGTDLASLKTRAVRDGDEWVISGQKIYTSLAGYADYIWLAARTDPDAPKHQGISIFAVPTATPGFSYSPIHTLVSSGTTNTFYDNVRVPTSALIGTVHKGWKLITNQLNYERVAIAPPGMVDKVFQDTVAWARATTLPDGRRVVDQEWVRTNLARVHARLEYLKLANWKAITCAEPNPGISSTTKVFGSEFFCEAYRLLQEVYGAAGMLRGDAPGAPLRGRLERAYQGTLFLTFGGGVNEVQRDLIALFGLGMPRVPRH
ncbi:MAG: acyl-CoA dehydrogenase family protein [Deltaproteobacteria bacterium]|nr:acyl-CoA dehydrogenase family protein [Deltaproteobacteria bacterium]